MNTQVTPERGMRLVGKIAIVLLVLIVVVGGALIWGQVKDNRRIDDARSVAHAKAQQVAHAYVDKLTADLAKGPAAVTPQKVGLLGTKIVSDGTRSTLYFQSSQIYMSRGTDPMSSETICYTDTIDLSHRPPTSDLKEMPCRNAPTGDGSYDGVVLSPK